MNTKQILTATALAGILTLAAQTARAEHDHDSSMKEQKTLEKCYGVAKSAQNDCATSAHSCAAHTSMDGDKNEWISVPTGLCNKLVNGSLTPPADTMQKDGMKKDGMKKDEMKK